MKVGHANPTASTAAVILTHFWPPTVLETLAFIKENYSSQVQSDNGVGNGRGCDKTEVTAGIGVIQHDLQRDKLCTNRKETISW